MAENGVEGNEDTAEERDWSTGWFHRMQRCLQEEVTLLSRCVRSVSPDRSSAVVLFLLLFATSITCLLTRYLMASQPERFPSYIVTWLIIGFQAAATICLVASVQEGSLHVVLVL